MLKIGITFTSLFSLGNLHRKLEILSTSVFEMYMYPFENSVGLLPALGFRHFFLKDVGAISLKCQYQGNLHPCPSVSVRGKKVKF